MGRSAGALDFSRGFAAVLFHGLGRESLIPHAAVERAGTLVGQSIPIHFQTERPGGMLLPAIFPLRGNDLYHWWLGRSHVRSDFSSSHDWTRSSHPVDGNRLLAWGSREGLFQAEEFQIGWHSAKRQPVTIRNHPAFLSGQL